MPTTINKQRLLNYIFTHLLKGGKTGQNGARSPQEPAVLEQFLYAVCREGATREDADRAYQNLRERFFDWNELRVSSEREVSEAFDGLPETLLRAQRTISFLQEVFETTYSFDLESLRKKGLKQAAKQLGRYVAGNDYAVAWVIQHSLDGHAVPLDGPALRVLRRLGLVDEGEENCEALRASLEHHVPKPKGGQFYEAISLLASDVCFEDEPNCSACPMLCQCAFGQECRAAVASEGSSRHKPR